MISTSNASNFDTWWNDTFDYRKDITLVNPTGEVHLNFPVYINVTYESVMQSDYDDIRIINESCTFGGNDISTMDFEIETSNTNSAVVWLRIPSLGAGNTSLCMYYGNSTLASGQAGTSVWNSNFGLVYHMDSTGQDATSNNRDRVSDVGTPVTNNTFLGLGMTFDGVNDAWSLADLEANNGYWEGEWFVRSHEVVFRTSSDVTSRQTLLAEGGGTNGVMMYIVNGGLFARYWSESSPAWSGDHLNVSISQDTTYHAVMTFDDSGNYSLHLNGVMVEEKVAPDHVDGHTGNGGIGYTGGSSKDYHDVTGSSGNYFDGAMYEFRAMDTQESDQWINMTAFNILNYTSSVVFSTQQNYTPNLSVEITSPPTASVYFTAQNATSNINATITCTGKPTSSCGNLSNFIQRNVSVVFNNISTIAGTLPIWTSSLQPQNCALDGGSSCNLTWIVNTTGVPGTEHIIRILSFSNLTSMTNGTSDNLTVKIQEGNAISFNQTSYNFGSFEKNSGDRTYNLTVQSVIGNNTNIVVECQSGDCSRITEDWVDGVNINEGLGHFIRFTCNDAFIGTYSATFNVTSDEVSGVETTIVSCEVTPIFGPINATVNEPSIISGIPIRQNNTFRFNGTVNCNGVCNNITTYPITGHEFGDGTDGSLTVSSAGIIVNNYTYLTGDENLGDTTILVNSGIAFGGDDEILIIQVQNGTGGGIAGVYEFVEIDNVSGNNLNLKSSLVNNYRSGTFNALSSSATQVIRVPEYVDVTVDSASSIVSPAWDGQVGGIVVFRANGTITMNGYINVSQRGFRGGDCNGCGDNAWGDQGEGYEGLGSASQSANANGGGGGYGPTGLGGEPGAGGGHATVGGNGLGQHTTDATGGVSIGSTDLSRIYMGGGAGGGGDNDNLAPFAENVDGGGIAIVSGNRIINARIIAEGEEGGVSQNNGGTTGAGAGGTIWIKANHMSLADVDASGGAQVLGFGSDFGGAGGDGRVRLDYINFSSGITSPGSQYNGTAYDLYDVISNMSSGTPFWTSETIPQNCIVDEDGSCTFEWYINASGLVNTTHNISFVALSNVSTIDYTFSETTIINIVYSQIPIVNLFYPQNGTNILSHGFIDFVFSIIDNQNNVTCKIYVDDVVQNTTVCDTNINVTQSLPISGGYHNWSVEVNDSELNGVNSSLYNFTLIDAYHMKIEKSFESINENQFLLDLVLTNFNANITTRPEVLDFAAEGFTYGSFNFLNNITNFSKLPLNGTVLIWEDFKVENNSNNWINYSIVNAENSSVVENYMIGLE